MKRMQEKILSEATVLPGGVLKVGSFLNQQIDTVFLKEIGEEIARLFKDSGATKILTVEASGIAVAVAAGMAMELPVVFAKKNKSSNVTGEIYKASIHSFTHGVEKFIMVSKEYLPEGEKILIVDDFLAHGSALNGLYSITKEAKCELVGCCTVIEKGFQHGGDNLRARGIRIESLAIIDEMTDVSIIFRDKSLKMAGLDQSLQVDEIT